MKRAILPMLAAALAMFGSGRPAHAESPIRREMVRVERLAERLERAAIRVHNLAESQVHHLDRDEMMELNRLRELEAIASNFRDMIERYDDEPYRTEVAFDRLMLAYGKARGGLDELHAYDEVYDAFDQVRGLMGELRPYYDEDDWRERRDDDSWSRD